VTLPGYAMQDAFAYCAELVRTNDRDRYLATLFAPAESRGALYALYAFDSEVARVRELAHQPLPGEIRLQWWTDVLRGERSGEASANPVACALLAAIVQQHDAAARLIDLVDARRFDLYDEPMAGIADLEVYARRTSSVVFALAAQILSGSDAKTVAEPAGIAYAIVGLLRALPLHAARHQISVPMEVLDRHQVSAEELFVGRTSAGLNAALSEMRNLASQHLAAAAKLMTELPSAALPAFLSLAPVRPWLARLARSDAFAPADIAHWRRQWLIWRAARNPSRIAR
jgi:15-cis-phytoene synthase